MWILSLWKKVKELWWSFFSTFFFLSIINYRLYCKCLFSHGILKAVFESNKNKFRIHQSEVNNVIPLYLALQKFKVKNKPISESSFKWSKSFWKTVLKIFIFCQQKNQEKTSHLWLSTSVLNSKLFITESHW